jgi:SAM-dependent methyltransferase/3',5'-cyclic AMP phosphodiesterase CpdA
MLTWLHISDLHFRKGTKWQSERVLNALIDDLRELKDRNDLVPDIVLITGDIAFSGKKEEYESAKAFVDDLHRVYDLGPDRFYVVPGNHDLDRRRITVTTRLLVRQLLERKDEDLIAKVFEESSEQAGRQALLDPFIEYNSFAPPDCSMSSDQFFWTKRLKIPGFERHTVLLGFNSAWTALEDKQKDLLLGSFHVEKALSHSKATKSDFVIALMHHPPSWLADWDEQEVSNLLFYRADFVLRGHLHKQDQVMVPRGAIQIAAGCAFETRNRANSYNFVRVDDSRGKATLLTRRWFAESGGIWTWDPTIGDESDKPGRLELVLPVKIHPGKMATEMSVRIKPPEGRPSPLETPAAPAERKQIANSSGKPKPYPYSVHNFLDKTYVDGFYHHPDNDPSTYGTIPNFDRSLQADLIIQLPSFNPRDKIRILDLGCGPGLIGIELAKRYPSADIFFLDNSPAMLQKCQRKIDEFLESEVRQGIEPERKLLTIEANIEGDWRSSIPAMALDYIFSVQTLHHFPPDDKKAIFQAAISLLANKGLLLISDRIAIHKESFPLYRSLWNLQLGRADKARLKDTFSYVDLRREEDHRGDIPSTLEDQLKWLTQYGLFAECFWRHGNRAVFGGQLLLDSPEQ